MKSPAQCVKLNKTLSVEKLPNIIKRKRFEEVVAAEILINDARVKAKSIVDQANLYSDRLKKEAEVKALEIEESAYRAGIERAELDTATGMTELATMADIFMREYESSLVKVVTEALVEIVSTFNDKSIVLETVRKAVSTFGPSTNIDLWVSPSMSLSLDAGIKEILLPTVLTVRVDPVLLGSQCRLDNGRMILEGDVSVQVEAVRVAMQQCVSSDIKG